MVFQKIVSVVLNCLMQTTSISRMQLKMSTGDLLVKEVVVVGKKVYLKVVSFASVLCYCFPSVIHWPASNVEIEME